MAEEINLKRMWADVFAQALKDLFPSSYKRSIAQDVYYKSAAWWFEERDDERFNSFHGLCDLLNMDPDKIRERITNDLPGIRVRIKKCERQTKRVNRIRIRGSYAKKI